MDTNANTQNHPIEDCAHPNLLVKCPECLVTSSDGSGHSNSCPIVNTISGSRMDIYAEVPLPLFKLRIENPNDVIHLLNKETGIFEKVEENKIIHAHEVNGIFRIFKSMGKSIIGFDATAINRFSVAVAVAYLIGEVWRLRYRMVLTHTDGVLCFPLHTTFEHQGEEYRIPSKFDLNTVLIVGIDPQMEESTVNVRVFANETGNIGDTFNGYHGTIVFDAFSDQSAISESLKPKQYGGSIRFQRNLYKSVRGNRQRVNFESSLCSNCSVMSFDGANYRSRSINTISSFRADIYARISMPLFKMCIENTKDVVYVLDKMSGLFEGVQNKTILQAHSVNGVFFIDENSIEFQATSFKRFQVVVAYYSAGFFRVKYGITTQLHGVTCYALQHNLENRDDVYTIPNDLKMNTALVIGIVPEDDQSCVKLQVYGNSGTNGNVVWDNFLQELNISEALKDREANYDPDSNHTDDENAATNDDLNDDGDDSNNETVAATNGIGNEVGSNLDHADMTENDNDSNNGTVGATNDIDNDIGTIILDSLILAFSN